MNIERYQVALNLLRAVAKNDKLYHDVESATGGEPERIGEIGEILSDTFLDVIGVPKDTYDVETETGYLRDFWWDDDEDIDLTDVEDENKCEEYLHRFILKLRKSNEDTR